ncbi:MAG: cation:proton antiporter [Xanthomonadales bacterium]|nr:cation:proton antiporter [Xanthomonadales bacterium]
MHPITLLQDLAIILVVAAAATLLCHALRQPVVLGYLIAGLVIGPHTPPWPLIADGHTIQAFAEVGLVLLMFGLGLHFSIGKLMRVGRIAVIVALVEIVTMVALGYSLARAFGWGTMDALFLGAILSISSTTIIIKALQDLKMTERPFAQVIFGTLIVEDILAIAMLALLSGLSAVGGIEQLSMQTVAGKLGELALFLVLTTVAGLLVLPRLFAFVARYDSDEMLLVTALGVCFAISLLAYQLEYSIALGAFLAGVLVSESPAGARIEASVAPVRDMFSAVFFVAIGMMIDPAVLAQYWLPVALITLVVVVGKVGSCALGAFLAGAPPQRALRSGMGMAQIGEFSFIIAQHGTAAGVVSSFLYPITVAVSAVTTFLTPYLIRGSDGFARLLSRWLPEPLKQPARYYQRWLHSLGAVAEDDRRMIRRILRRITLYIVLDLALVVALLAFAGLLANRFRSELDALWPHASWTVPIAALVLCLPIVIHAIGKQRALAMALADLGVGSGRPFGRALLRHLLFVLMLVPLLLIVFGFAIAAVGPGPGLVLLALLVAIAAVLWRQLASLYTRAQLDITATLSERPPDTPQ